MTNPVILLGTQSNGETLPVQVDATGRLVAEGLPGPPGPEGPEGPQGPAGPGGDGIDLPPDPSDGALLGWQDGELVWVGGSQEVVIDYLIVGGGGAAYSDSIGGGAGGGAGGLLNSFSGEQTGGGGSALSPLAIPVSTTGTRLNISVGDPGQDSTLAVGDTTLTAYAGGAGNGGTGGSGGGQMYYMQGEEYNNPIGVPVNGQGSIGGSGGIVTNSDCINPNRPDLACHSSCRGVSIGGGGGGAGAPGDSKNGGRALQSAITGTPTYYASGGSGWGVCQDYYGTTPNGVGSPGSGQGKYDAAQRGIVVLRHPSNVVVTTVNGNLERETISLGNDLVTQFISGAGEVKFSIPLRRVLRPTFNVARQS